TWRAPYSSRPHPSSSPLATLNGGAARGYVAVPRVERAVAVHLCPWWDRLHLPSGVCKVSSALTGRACYAAGQVATALDAMATLQVYQAQALKYLHEGGPDQGVMQELHAVADFALRATKVTAHSLGQVMSTVVVQGRHLWLTLAQMADVDKARFLDAPISQGSVFGDTFSAVQKQTAPDALPPQILTRSSTSPAREPGKKTFLQNVLPSGISPLPLPPPGCPTAVTSVNVPLIPLATRLGAWLQLPSPSQWLIRTVRLGYAIQFTRRPPRYRGVLSTSVHSDTHAAVLRAEVAVLLAKDAIEPVPPAEMKSGFYSPYFIVPKKSGGLRPIQALNWSLLRLPFKMLTTKRMLTCIRHQDWFATIDLKDAPFLRFAFEGRAYQYKVLPFGLSLSPRVFTKVTEAALSPLWRMGIRILNYLDDWLLIAHSRDVLCEHRDLVLRHLSHLGLQVNREKSKLSPVQRISFPGVELDSVNMTACLTIERSQSVLNCLNSFRHKTAVPLKTFSLSTVQPTSSHGSPPILENGDSTPSPSLEDPLEERPSFSGDGHNLAPASRPMEPALLAPGRDASDLSGLSQAVIETITQQAYALRWGLFVDWCSSRGEDPQRCLIAVVLSFLQEKLERRLSPSTLKVYVAAIAAYHDAVDGASLEVREELIPPRPHLVPSWDLSVTLQGLREAPFELLASVELKHLSLKTALLTALASIKRVGDLQAFSVDDTCLEFGPSDSHVILRPRPGYVPKVPTTPFRDQVVNLQALPLEEADPASALLCPVRVLHIYVDRTRHFRHTEQLFVYFGGQQKGNAVSKQRLAHWVVDAISLSYQNQGEPCPLGVHAHFPSLADICRAAGWATPNTFARFYNLRIEAVHQVSVKPAGVGLLRHSYRIRALYPSVVPPGEPWVLHAPQSGLAAE
ncbi:hypothetical protein M9458_044586, partial [Cirrhinus mrigala]